LTKLLCYTSNIIIGIPKKSHFCVLRKLPRGQISKFENMPNDNASYNHQPFSVIYHHQLMVGLYIAYNISAGGAVSPCMVSTPGGSPRELCHPLAYLLAGIGLLQLLPQLNCLVFCEKTSRMWVVARLEPQIASFKLTRSQTIYAPMTS